MDISKKLQAEININSGYKWQVSSLMTTVGVVYYTFASLDFGKKDRFKIWSSGNIEVLDHSVFMYDELMILPSLSNLVIRSHEEERRKLIKEGQLWD